MTLEKDFPNLKNKVCQRDGLQSCTSFQIKNALDFEDLKALLNQKFLHVEDVDQYCIEKQVMRELIEETMTCDWDEPFMYKDPKACFMIHSKDCKKCKLLARLK